MSNQVNFDEAAAFDDGLRQLELLAPEEYCTELSALLSAARNGSQLAVLQLTRLLGVMVKAPFAKSTKLRLVEPLD